MKPTKPSKTLEQQYDAALARAEHDGVRVVADVGDHWLVTSSQAGHSYTVRLIDDEVMLHSFACPCQTDHSKYLCKHTAVAFCWMVAQVTERGERELAGAVWNQVELFWLLIYAPLVEIAAGAAIGQQAKLDKEAKWQAYQTARQNEWYC